MNLTSSDYYKYVRIFSEHLVTFCIAENILPAIQVAITSTFTLLQIYLDCFDIYEKENKT